MYWNWEKKTIKRVSIRRKQIFKIEEGANIQNTKKKIKVFSKRTNEHDEVIYEKLNYWSDKFKQRDREIWYK